MLGFTRRRGAGSFFAALLFFTSSCFNIGPVCTFSNADQCRTNEDCEQDGMVCKPCFLLCFDSGNRCETGVACAQDSDCPHDEVCVQTGKAFAQNPFQSDDKDSGYCDSRLGTEGAGGSSFSNTTGSMSFFTTTTGSTSTSSTHSAVSGSSTSTSTSSTATASSTVTSASSGSGG